MHQLRIVISVVEVVIKLKTARKEILLPLLNKQTTCKTFRGGKGISTEINSTILTGGIIQICLGATTRSSRSSSRDLSRSSRGGVPMTCFQNTLKQMRQG